MTDRIIEAISSGDLCERNISYQTIRNIAGQDSGIWKDLGRGRSILQTPEHLDQYLFSYGPMINSQWQTLLDRISISGNSFTVFDYGCGQGIATIMLLDRYGESFAETIQKVVLIEPSEVALSRAAAIVRCYLPDTELKLVNKLLDDVLDEELQASPSDVKLHLFSNVLDVEGFDQYNLFSGMFDIAGRHIVLAVGNDRNTHGGTERLQMLFELMNDEGNQDWIGVKDSRMESFTTDRGQSAMYFFVELEV